MDLQLFEDGAGAGSGNQGGNAGSGNGGQGSAGGASGAHAGTYTYEQLEEIASARVNKSERAALANFFRSQGMTEAEVTEAITQFKNERAANQPDTAKLQRERDDAEPHGYDPRCVPEDSPRRSAGLSAAGPGEK